MSIFEAIKKLRERLTGQPGKGASITEAINDLTEGLTGAPGVGASIADAIDNLAEHADDISIGGGGSGSSLTVIYDGDIVAEEFDGRYGGQVTPDTPFPYDHDATREGCPETITVVFNGTTYSDVPWDEDLMGYGSGNFSDYPFVIGFYSQSEEVYDNLWMMTTSAGTFSVKVSADVEEGGSGSPFKPCNVTVTILTNGYLAIPYVTNFGNLDCGVISTFTSSGMDMVVPVPTEESHYAKAWFIKDDPTEQLVVTCTGGVHYDSHEGDIYIGGNGTLRIEGNE